jgi:hypothetical protein
MNLFDNFFDRVQAFYYLNEAERAWEKEGRVGDGGRSPLLFIFQIELWVGSMHFIKYAGGLACVCICLF